MKAGICHPPFVPLLAYIYNLLRGLAWVIIKACFGECCWIGNNILRMALDGATWASSCLRLQGVMCHYCDVDVTLLFVGKCRCMGPRVTFLEEQATSKRRKISRTPPPCRMKNDADTDTDVEFVEECLWNQKHMGHRLWHCRKSSKTFQEYLTPCHHRGLDLLL